MEKGSGTHEVIENYLIKQSLDIEQMDTREWNITRLPKTNTQPLPEEKARQAQRPEIRRLAEQRKR